jgi:hypothetical protein
VIITVMMTANNARDHWRAELAEYSWQQVGQSGELVRLVACNPGEPLPTHDFARVIGTRSWSHHPYIADYFEAYNQPASLLEWLIRERVDATLVLLDSSSILLEAFNEEVEPGGAIGNTWRDLETGDKGPFGLPEIYNNLNAYCVNRQLKLPKVQFPLLIHSSDLLKILPRWLELTGLIRNQVRSHLGALPESGSVAYTIAAAEYRIPHKSRKLAVTSTDGKTDRPVLCYQLPIESKKGKIVWDIEVYKPWESCEAKQAKPGAGRAFLDFLQNYVELRESFGLMKFKRPRKCAGVREARVLDRVLLEVPGRSEPLSLNSSAGEIWKLCDSQRSMAEMADELEKKFDVPHDLLCADVETAINQLQRDGAVDLEIAR